MRKKSRALCKYSKLDGRNAHFRKAAESIRTTAPICNDIELLKKEANKIII